MTMVVDELRGMKWNRDKFVGGLLLVATMKVGTPVRVGGGPVEVMGCTGFLFIYYG